MLVSVAQCCGAGMKIRNARTCQGVSISLVRKQWHLRKNSLSKKVTFSGSHGGRLFGQNKGPQITAGNLQSEEHVVIPSRAVNIKSSEPTVCRLRCELQTNHTTLSNVYRQKIKCTFFLYEQQNNYVRIGVYFQKALK